MIELSAIANPLMRAIEATAPADRLLPRDTRRYLDSRPEAALPALAALATAMPAKVKRPDDYRELADAICSGDPARAKKAAEDVLELANTTLMAALESAGNRR